MGALSINKYREGGALVGGRTFCIHVQKGVDLSKRVALSVYKYREGAQRINVLLSLLGIHTSPICFAFPKSWSDALSG